MSLLLINWTTSNKTQQQQQFNKKIEKTSVKCAPPDDRANDGRHKNKITGQNVEQAKDQNPDTESTHRRCKTPLTQKPQGNQLLDSFFISLQTNKTPKQKKTQTKPNKKKSPIEGKKKWENTVQLVGNINRPNVFIATSQLNTFHHDTNYTLTHTLVPPATHSHTLTHTDTHAHTGTHTCINIYLHTHLG